MPKTEENFTSIRSMSVRTEDGWVTVDPTILSHMSGITIATATTRLRAFARGLSSVEQLLSAAHNGEALWDNMEVGPRMAIEDIPITKYERELGRELDRRNYAIPSRRYD